MHSICDFLRMEVARKKTFFSSPHTLFPIPIKAKCGFCHLFPQRCFVLRCDYRVPLFAMGYSVSRGEGYPAGTPLAPHSKMSDTHCSPIINIS